MVLRPGAAQRPDASHLFNGTGGAEASILQPRHNEWSRNRSFCAGVPIHGTG